MLHVESLLKKKKNYRKQLFHSVIGIEPSSKSQKTPPNIHCLRVIPKESCRDSESIGEGRLLVVLQPFSSIDSVLIKMEGIQQNTKVSLIRH